ncbi:alpha-isopropylmalate synthase regulatory domain-containing protein, partial [Aciditerrimonas ferrireducens]
KGGVAYIMKTEHGLDLPRRLQIEFSAAIQHVTEDTGTEITPEEMWGVFEREYLSPHPSIELVRHQTTTEDQQAEVAVTLRVDGEVREARGRGSGPVAAFVHALNSALGTDLEVTDYAEHALQAGSEATAAAYVEARSQDGVRWGVGIDQSILAASYKAVLSALGRLERLAPEG